MSADGEIGTPVSLLDQPPAEWFGKPAGDSNGDVGQPTKLGKVLQLVPLVVPSDIADPFINTGL